MGIADKSAFFGVLKHLKINITGNIKLFLCLILILRLRFLHPCGSCQIWSVVKCFCDIAYLKDTKETYSKLKKRRSLLRDLFFRYCIFKSHKGTVLKYEEATKYFMWFIRFQIRFANVLDYGDKYVTCTKGKQNDRTLT